MHGPHDTDPLAGDRCARCGRLMIEDAEVVYTADGDAVGLCPVCADEHIARGGRVAGPSPVDPEELTDRVHDLIQNSIDQHLEGQGRLREIGTIVEGLLSQLAESQARQLEAEERFRGLETELAHTRELLQRAEALLVVTAPGPDRTATEEHISPHLPAHTPQMATSAKDLAPADVRATQKLFNESRFVEKTRSVRRGLGRPSVNLAAVVGSGRKALLTIAWDIVWYQYLVDLSADAADPADAVVLFGEGMELSELPENLRQGNAIVDDQGRLDASELELSLEADHPAHRTAQDDAVQQEIEDATEEIWDRTTMPEFRWDD